MAICSILYADFVSTLTINISKATRTKFIFIFHIYNLTIIRLKSIHLRFTIWRARFAAFLIFYWEVDSFWELTQQFLYIFWFETAWKSLQRACSLSIDDFGINTWGRGSADRQAVKQPEVILVGWISRADPHLLTSFALRNLRNKTEE